MDNNLNNDIFLICRTCIKEITDAHFFYLDYIPTASTQLTIRQKLYSCIPEIDLSITSNTVICDKCLDNLLSMYEFKRNCLQSEIHINNYIQQVPTTHSGDVLNLIEVARFQQLHIKNLDIEVKMEDLEITEDFKNEDRVCDTSAFNTVSKCTDSTEPKYLLKLAEVDIEDVLFNTFGNISYNLSVTEENSDTLSNMAQNCLPELVEYQDNLNKTYAYYQCYKCGHKAESKLKLILHLKRHTRKNFHHREVISKSLSGYHKNLFCYRCSLCNYLTKYKCLFEFHNRIHLTKKDYKHIFKCADVHRLAFHTIKVNKTNIKSHKRKCNNYDKHRFKNRNETKQHFSHGSSLKPHNIVEKLFKCSICEYQYNCKGTLKRHIMRTHAEEKPFTCSICEYQCSEKSDLKKHILIHTGEKPFLCSVCEYRGNQKQHLKRHIMRTHTQEKPVTCSICEYQCSEKSDLKKHILIHTGEKPFSCYICKYQCRQKSNLKQHMQIHTGEKEFSCSVCKYQCNWKNQLKRHMRIHTGEKPFSCPVCKFKCNEKSDLNRHLLIHTGEKPFLCSVCKYQCNKRCNLKRHMRIHAGEKPFQCSVCN